MRSQPVRIVWGIAGFLIVMFPALLVTWDGIPNHGFLFRLTVAEIVALLWIPLSTFLLCRRGDNRTWWVFYGMTCFIMMFPSFRQFILHPAGRRPWMFDPHWPCKLAVLLFIVLGASILSAAFGSNRQQRNEAGGDANQ